MSKIQIWELGLENWHKCRLTSTGVSLLLPPLLRSRQPNVCLAVLFLAKKSPNVFGGFISGQNLGSQNSVKIAISQCILLLFALYIVIFFSRASRAVEILIMLSHFIIQNPIACDIFINFYMGSQRLISI